MKRVFNFSAGPAILPESVLKEAQEELLNYNNTGMSVMEISHRTKPFEEILNNAISDLRSIMNIPDNYKVIFVQGGASLQFACVPLNLMKNKKADYIVTGQFAEKAYKAMKGAGTNEEALKDAIIGLSSKQAAEVAEVFEEKYGKSLRKRIEKETSGQLRKILLSYIPE